MANDIAQGPAFTIVIESPVFTGATYGESSGDAALRVASLGSNNLSGGTCRIALTDLTSGAVLYSPYVGAIGTQLNMQMSFVVVPWKLGALNPAHSYKYSLIFQKGSTDGQLQVFDATISSEHNGTNQ